MRIAGLRDRLEAGLTEAVPGFRVNGDTTRPVPGILSCAFPGADAETLLVALDQREVYAASGSACTSGATEPSHVLLAMGIAPELARASVRFSLGHTTTEADIDTPLAIIPGSRTGSWERPHEQGHGDDEWRRRFVGPRRCSATGHDVTGVTLKLWGGESDSGCCSASDVEDARRVAAQLGIPHYVFNFTDDFDKHVVGTYVDAYAQGETPNPCVECNRTMKFGRVIDRAVQLGFDEVATGHHARIVETPNGRAIGRGADPAKDQSYVLYMLGARELARTRLPIGEMTKAEVRERAHDLGLRTAEKRESMDVCFIKHGARRAFLGSRIGRRPGVIVDTAGAEVGAHDGVDHFTIGQRRGTGVAQGERRYVVDIASDSATVTVGPRPL